MKFFIGLIVICTYIYAGNFTLKSSDLTGQLTKKQEFSGFGCTGENISPSLSWYDAPKATKSFAITMYDPDAPTGSGWWHWIVYNIPKGTHHIKSNASGEKMLPKGSVEGFTDYKTRGFGGACPPKGDKAHRYIVTIYALDIAKIAVKKDANPALLGYMINAHTIAKSSLISYYQR
ncbi:YbhB/YbcL family Raf kinase inhibitor-like protein [Sulfurimonas sp.]